MGRTKGGTNRKRHQQVCVMDAVPFFSARPDCQTCSNRCRLHLCRWRKVWGAAPINPPGKRQLHAPYWNKDAWIRAYVDVPAYEQHKKKKKTKRRPA